MSTLYELHAAESVADFSSAAVALMDAAFPGSLITFDRIDADTGRYEVALNRTIPDAAETTRRVAACVARDNPLVALIAALPRSAPVTPYRLSDHLPPERFWRTELYAVGFAPFGARYQLAVALRGGDEFLAFGINRATVKRHCEKIYAKLGIRGRTTARRENPGPSTHGG